MARSTTNSSNATATGTIIPLPISRTETTAESSNCKLDGSADGIQQKFDTAKYQAYMMVLLLDARMSGTQS
jgi:hypothetical protein